MSERKIAVGDVLKTEYGGYPGMSTERRSVTFMIVNSRVGREECFSSKTNLYTVAILDSSHDAWEPGETFYPVSYDFKLLNAARRLL